jgi:hypothetical protein
LRWESMSVTRTLLTQSYKQKNFSHRFLCSLMMPVTIFASKHNPAGKKK